MYHAGVLRALHEAGVRIDIVAGHGIGAATAVLAAMDGGGKLLDEGGLWLSPRARCFYQWRWPLRVAGWLTVALAAVFAVPLVLLAAGVVLMVVAFLLTSAGLAAGTSLNHWIAPLLTSAFDDRHLPTWVPRGIMLVVVAGAIVLCVGGLMMREPRTGMRRAAGGQWWWYLLASPLDVEPLRKALMGRLWDLVRGAATTNSPSSAVLSRRYSEALAENLGQPGCRELMLAVTDLDARRDVVGALLSPALRASYFAAKPGRERGAEVVDLAGSGRDVVMDLLGAALTPSIGAEAQPIAYPTDGYWRGETHRGCDRPGILARLLAELDAAQVVQVIVVSAAAPPAAPHRLRAPVLDPRARLGEFCAAAEGAALEDAVSAARTQFDSLYVICPAHNPVGPFDLAGAYDEGSDRRRALIELQQQGYQDAYQQFIDPIVGASGEQLRLH